MLEFEWCFRFTRSVLCSPSIQVEEEDFAHCWSNGEWLVCMAGWEAQLVIVMRSWFMETHKERSSPKSWGDRWPEGIGAEGNGRSVDLSAAVGSDALPVWSLIEAHFKLEPRLSQAWGGDSSELPEDPRSSVTCFLLTIASIRRRSQPGFRQWRVYSRDCSEQSWLCMKKVTLSMRPLVRGGWRGNWGIYQQSIKGGELWREVAMVCSVQIMKPSCCPSLILARGLKLEGECWSGFTDQMEFQKWGIQVASEEQPLLTI